MTRAKEPSHGVIPEGAFQENIAAAMRELPLWVSSDFREEQISRFTEKYVYMSFDRAYVEKTPLTPIQFKSELSAIERKSRALFEGLMRMHWQTTETLNSCMVPTVGEIKRSLELLSASCAKAPAPNSAKLHHGRDRKLIPLKVAKVAVCDFQSLTGKKPTWSGNRGGFPDFLSAVFKALNMDDSIETFGKRASSWWHKERSNEVMESLREIMLKPISVVNSEKVTVDIPGEILELKDTINTMVDQLNGFASEVTRVAREVGTEGGLGGQAQVLEVARTWKDLTDSVNSMSSNLTAQVRDIVEVMVAVQEE
jgi:hypothetical protein